MYSYKDYQLINNFPLKICFNILFFQPMPAVILLVLHQSIVIFHYHIL